MPPSFNQNDEIKENNKKLENKPINKKECENSEDFGFIN